MFFNDCVFQHTLLDGDIRELRSDVTLPTRKPIDSASISLKGTVSTRITFSLAFFLIFISLLQSLFIYSFALFFFNHLFFFLTTSHFFYFFITIHSQSYDIKYEHYNNISKWIEQTLNEDGNEKETNVGNIGEDEGEGNDEEKSSKIQSDNEVR